MLPHKRSFRDMGNQSPTHQSKGNAKSGGKAWRRSHKGFIPFTTFSAVGLTDDNHFPTSVQLKLITSETNEHGKKNETRALVRDHPPRDVNETSPNSTKSPWLSIAENIQEDLHASFQNVVNKIQCESSRKIKPSFVARIGKVHFHGCDVSLDTILNEVLRVENTSESKQKKTFYTNVPKGYMKAVKGQVDPRTEFGNASRIEHYLVRVHDKLGENLSFKCSATKDGSKLELRKVKSMTKRHFFQDTLCLNKDFDLRLTLFTRKTFGQLDDIYPLVKKLIKTAKIHKNAAGGLIWRRGRSNNGRLSIGAVSHKKVEVFKGPTMTLKLINADRFNVKSCEAEKTKEVDVKMTEITKQLRDEKVPESEVVDRMFKEDLKLVWEQLLNYNISST